MNRKEFLDILRTASIGMAKGSMLEQADHFIFRKGKIIAYNEEVCVRATCPGLEAFRGAVPGALLLKAVTSFPDNEITIEGSETELRITGASRPAGVGIKCADIKITTSDVPKPGESFVLPDWFTEALIEASRCCSTDQLSGATTCVRIAPKVIEAFDNYRVYRISATTGFPSDFFMHCSAASQLKGLRLQEASLNGGWCHFNVDGARVSVRGREFNEFPDLKSVIKFEGATVTLPTALADAANRCAVMSDGDAEVALVKLRISDKEVKVSARGVSGWAHETVPMIEGQSVPEPVVFSINPASLVSVLKQDEPVTIGKERMKVRISSGWYCCVLQQADSE